VVIPAMAATVFDASSIAGWPQGAAYALTVAAPAPIVVGRSVLAPPSAQPPGWGASSGSSSPSTGWLVIGPGVPGAPAVAGATVRTLAVADTGGSPASVVVTVLGGGLSGTRATVAPHSLVVFGPSQIGGVGPYTVRSSVPVVVEADAGPSGAPGVIAGDGVPLPS
jgi:hypothetical protein